jgi:hypothetical protein
MSNNNNKYRDNSFQIDHTYTYVLLLRAGNESFSYAIVYNGHLLASEDNCSFDRLSGTDEVLSARYKHVVIGYDDLHFFLVPIRAFGAGQLAEAARFLDVKSNERVFSHALDGHNEVVFKGSESALAALTAKYPSAEIVISATGWIRLIEQSDPSSKNLYINLFNDRLDILNFKNGKLRFYNHFETKSPDEVVYFSSLIAAELQLQPMALKLVISGDISDGDAFHQHLAGFFADIEFNPLTAVKLPEASSAHRISFLSALHLCAL